MKAAMVVLNWDQGKAPIVDFIDGPDAILEAQACWEAIKHEWPGCTVVIEPDEALREATRTRPT